MSRNDKVKYKRHFNNKRDRVVGCARCLNKKKTKYLILKTRFR